MSGDPFELVHPKRHFNSQNNLLQRECQRLQHFHSTKHFAFPVKMPHALDVVESFRVVVVVVLVALTFAWKSRAYQISKLGKNSLVAPSTSTTFKFSHPHPHPLIIEVSNSEITKAA